MRQNPCRFGLKASPSAIAEAEIEQQLKEALVLRSVRTLAEYGLVRSIKKCALFACVHTFKSCIPRPSLLICLRLSTLFPIRNREL